MENTSNLKLLNIKPAERFKLYLFHAKLAKEQRLKGIETQRQASRQNFL